jgi:hypothetical protein
MKVLVIGLKEENTPSRLLAKGFKEKNNWNVDFVSPEEILNQQREFDNDFNPQKYSMFKTPIELNEMFDIGEFDLVLICQNYLYFHLTAPSAPVVYYHSEIQFPPSLLNPDYLAMGYTECKMQWARFWPWYWFSIPNKFYLRYGVDPDEYKPWLPKRIPGLTFLGRANYTITNDEDAADFIRKDIYKNRKGILTALLQKNAVTHVKQLPYEDYRDYLSRTEATLILPGNNCYASQRIFEAAAAKSFIVNFCENKASRWTLEQLGFKHKESCLMLGLDILKLDEKAHYQYPEVVEAAYNLVIKNHTYKNRIEQILKETSLS